MNQICKLKNRNEVNRNLHSLQDEESLQHRVQTEAIFAMLDEVVGTAEVYVFNGAEETSNRKEEPHNIDAVVVSSGM